MLTTVGRYEVVREIGRGGMAVVHLAHQRELDRFVALKELGGFHVSDPALATRFLQEARVSGSLSHPNIVTVLDYFEHDGTPFIAMEYLERGSLRPYVGQMMLPQIGGVLESVLAGLAAGERRRTPVVHRDIKPENILVTHDGRVKIADYGIARATDRLQTVGVRTATGLTVGTPGYMAPEQAMAREVSAATDLYALGCVAFELVVGRLPFADTASPVGVLMRHINDAIPPVLEAAPDVPPELAAWIDALLVKDPAERPQSAVVAGAELEQMLIDWFGPRWRNYAVLPEPSEIASGPRQGASRGSAIVSMPGPYTPPPSNLVPLEDESDAFETYVPPPPRRQPPATPAPAAKPAAPPPPAPALAVAGLEGTSDHGHTLPPVSVATAIPSRRRPRRRMAAAGLGLALLVASATAVVAGSGGSDRPTHAGTRTRAASPRDTPSATALAAATPTETAVAAPRSGGRLADLVPNKLSVHDCFYAKPEAPSRRSYLCTTSNPSGLLAVDRYATPSKLSYERGIAAAYGFCNSGPHGYAPRQGGSWACVKDGHGASELVWTDSATSTLLQIYPRGKVRENRMLSLATALGVMQ